MGSCIVVGAGACYARKPSPAPDDFVIAADGGYETLRRLDIRIDAVIGDFDSLPGRPRHPNVIELPKEKDDSDMFAALRLGLQKGYDTFHIYGGAGGRLDHTLANLQCLSHLSLHGARGFLYCEDCVITCIRNGHMDFDNGYAGTVSIFSHSDTAKGVCLDGLKYWLQDAELRNFHPLGLSNEFIGVNSRISVADGTLLIVFPYGEAKGHP